MAKESDKESANYSAGLFYSGTGRVDEALYWLNKAYESHDTELYCLESEPFWQTLHDHPEWVHDLI
jgi:hypothetical protein